MQRRKVKVKPGTMDEEIERFKRESENKLFFRVEDAPESAVVRPPVTRVERRKTHINMIRELADKQPGAYIINYRVAKIFKRTTDGVRILLLTPNALERLRQQTEKKRREEDRKIKGYEKKHKKKLL